MSSSILEFLRLNHEQSERYESAFGEVLDQKPNGQKAKVEQQHQLKTAVDKIIEINTELESLQMDVDGLYEEELSQLRENPLDSFYLQLQSTIEYYEKFSGLEFAPQAPVKLESNVTFSGEEIFGKYLDLTPLFLQFCNLLKKHSTVEQDYLQYLERFSSFFYLPMEVRRTRHYADYLQQLWDYLSNYYCRVNPLNDLDSAIKDWDTTLEEKIQSGEISLTTTATKKKEAQALRLGMFNDSKELEALGLDRLKEGLEALGLKCGGTLQDRAQRLWSVRGKKPEEIPANLKAKPSTAAKNGESQQAEDDRSPKHAALLEYRIASLCEVIGDVVSATRRHAEKQQALTFEEKQNEIMQEEFGLLPQVNDMKDGDGMDDDDVPIYNPLNLPLGWDGKPIPLWMYKLHGLGVEYKCEVCGNQSYWGRRAFDRHFQEWKHAYGMRCLGVPNTKHFHDITSIEEVVSLYSKIKDQLKQEQFVADNEEEFEDTHGNVLNRRTYEDLARQDLL
jgi:splicing factor 3A subunit 3